MRSTLLILLSVPFFLELATTQLAAQSDAPMQVCTSLVTENCASYPTLLKPPQIRLSPTPTGAPADPPVGLNIVVGADGSVHNVESLKTPDSTHKQQVISSAWDWKFAPATFKGRPVAVKIQVIIEFHAVGNLSVRLAPWRATWVTLAELQAMAVEANQARSRADYAKAIAVSRQLLALEPLYRGIRFTLSESLLALHQYEDAEAALEEEIKLDPKSPYAYNSLGWTFQQHHKFDEAIAQYKKQIEITPDAFNPHENLGVLLTARNRCGEAMPELEKALSVSPGQARVVLAQGKCDIDLGNTAKGISELEQAASKNSSSGWWNEAAYRLAERNVELDTAKKWVEKAIAIDSVYLRDISLDHVTPTQMRLVNAMANFWDTLGWVYFRLDKFDRALTYVDAAWRMDTTPTKGDHLGQIYEKLGQKENATRTYAMAIASADLSKRGPSDPEDLDDAKERLRRLSGNPPDLAPFIEKGRSALDALNSVPVDNPSKLAGEANFILRIVGNKTFDVRQIGGPPSFVAFSDSLRKVAFPATVPEENGLEILRRGILKCKSEAEPCLFTLLKTQKALDLATKEDNGEKPQADE